MQDIHEISCTELYNHIFLTLEALTTLDAICQQNNHPENLMREFQDTALHCRQRLVRFHGSLTYDEKTSRYLYFNANFFTFDTVKPN